MCEKCKRIQNPNADMIVHMRTREVGTQEEFRQQFFLKFCPCCGGKIGESEKHIIEEVSPLKIKIKYFYPDVEPIEKIAVGDWIDLRAAMTIKFNKGQYGLIPLGVGMILPDGYEAHVLPRSSTPNKFGIMCANSMGIIDNSYSGDADEWHFPAVAIRDTVILKGDRIAQFRIVKNQPSIEFEVVEHLNAVSRGGIGSTGAR